MALPALGGCAIVNSGGMTDESELDSCRLLLLFEHLKLEVTLSIPDFR